MLKLREICNMDNGESVSQVTLAHMTCITDRLLAPAHA
jgi:hypothetical protein